MKITRSQLKSLIKEEMNRASSGGNAQDAALVYARMNPDSGELGVLRTAWKMGEYQVIIDAGEKENITPDSAFEYFTTPGEGLHGLGHTVVPMYNSMVQSQGKLAALNQAINSWGATFDIPGWDFMNPDLPFGDVGEFVIARAEEQ